MERGYVKLWRKTLDSGLLQHPTALQVFMYLLLKTAAKPYKRIVAGQSVVVPVGATLTSRSTLSADLGITEKQARTALTLLEKLEIVTINRASKYSMVFFVNWSRYQHAQPAEGPAESPAEGPSKGQAGATLKEVKNINNPLDTTYLSPKGEAREKAKRFVPPTVEEVRAYCEERGNGIDAEAFHSFYASNGWKVGRNAMRDWRAAVRTWERKRREEGNLPALQGQQMPKATTVAQQRYVEQDAMARMLLQDRRMRDAQAGRHAQDHDEPCLTLPPGW